MNGSYLLHQKMVIHTTKYDQNVILSHMQSTYHEGCKYDDVLCDITCNISLNTPWWPNSILTFSMNSHILGRVRFKYTRASVHDIVPGLVVYIITLAAYLPSGAVKCSDKQ